MSTQLASAENLVERATFSIEKAKTDALRVLFEEAMRRPGSFQFILSIPSKMDGYPSLSCVPTSERCSLRAIVSSLVPYRDTYIYPGISGVEAVRNTPMGMEIQFSSNESMRCFCKSQQIDVDTGLVDSWIFTGRTRLELMMNYRDAVVKELVI